MLSASSRSAGTGVEHRATCVLVPASSPSEPPHPGGGAGRGGGDSGPPLAAPSLLLPSSAPLPSPFTRGAPRPASC